jgi:transposase
VHVNALDFLGGVMKAVVPDNLKAGITRPSRYEPGVNRSYQDLADHYGSVVLPARVRKPRDKAKVEAAVGIVSRYVLGRLRHRRFFSLDELNAAVRDCVTAINAKPMQRLGKRRNELFATLDRPALKPLPGERYQYAEWKRCTVAPDYHVEVDGHYYSVPYRLLRESVDMRFTGATVEVFHKRRRVASHARSHLKHKHTTTPEHMPPSSHRRYAEWSPARLLREGAKIGPATTALFEAIMKAKPHPEQGFRSCLGILGLLRSYGAERIEAAARRGNDIGAKTYGSIKSILHNGLDRAYAPRSAATLRRSSTPTSAAVATTTEPLLSRSVRAARTRRQRDECSAGGSEGDDTHAHTSHSRSSGRARAHRHGQGARRATRGGDRGPRHQGRARPRPGAGRQARHRGMDRAAAGSAHHGQDGYGPARCHLDRECRTPFRLSRSSSRQ